MQEIKLIKIEVTKLFGFYNYKVDHSQGDFLDNPLLVIYGDNGSGKTTLLKMIFYLLSPLHKSGHKTKLCEIKFNSFSISLSDGTVITAIRNQNEILGSYTLGIKIANEEVFEVYLKVNSDGAINLDNNPSVNAKYQIFLQKVSSLNIAINFLSEDRKLLSFADDHQVREKASRKRVLKTTIDGRHFFENLDDDRVDSVQTSVKILENWLKSSTLKGTKAGEENANTIYSNLLKQVSNPKKTQVSLKQVKSLLLKIKNIGEESLSFYKSGLVSQIETYDFETALKSANENNITLIYNILEPYIEGLQGRLNSLRTVQDVLSKFLFSINDYFSHKVIMYNIEEGFKLRHIELNEPIDLNNLSSGERQLLQLFCNVITSTERSTIFIIDEPEISLNIKWQRKLINTLLNFSTNKNIQFIFASHSIELLSGHSDSVYKLTSI